MFLSAPAGPGYTMNPSDVLSLKSALRELGFYAVPAHGLTPYPDTAMFDALKSLQIRLGLSPTGIMRPNGPEHREIVAALDDAQTAGGPDTTVHVHAYSQERDGQSVGVSAHERSAPGTGPGAPTGSSTDLPPMRNPVNHGVPRKRDGYGEGHFGAERKKANGMPYPHNGIDITASPGQAIESPVSGIITRTDVRPYNDDNRYNGIEIESDTGHTIKMFYMTPKVSKGTRVKAGEPIGTAQDISQKYPDKGKGPMTPHVHVEVRDKNGGIADPTGMVLNQ